MERLKYKIWIPYSNTMMQPVSIIYIQESQVSGVTIGQMKQWVWLEYTGQMDKNGDEMYEGDIFRWGNKIGKIVFQNACFVFNCPGFSMTLRDHLASEFEIIGNIHQHPDLLTQPVS